MDRVTTVPGGHFTSLLRVPISVLTLLVQRRAFGHLKKVAPFVVKGVHSEKRRKKIIWISGTSSVKWEAEGGSCPGRYRLGGSKQPRQTILWITTTKVSLIKFADQYFKMTLTASSGAMKSAPPQKVVSGSDAVWFLVKYATMLWFSLKGKKVKASHTCYQALGPELQDPGVQAQSARRWL